MGKKSKRHGAHAGAAKPAAGSLINNKTVCKVVEELWTSEIITCAIHTHTHTITSSYILCVYLV